MSFHLFRFSFVTTLFLLLANVPALAQDNCVDAGTGSAFYDQVDFADRPVTYYPAGDTVQICFSLDNDFNTPDVEWVHAVLIASVGPGFDFSTMMPAGTPPTACRAAGRWDWYPTWSRCQTNCTTQTTFTNGYAFDSSEGTNESCGDPAVLDGDPGNNFGDGPGNCGLIFCWTFETLDPGSIPAADAYAIEVQVLADGVSGGYSGGVGGFCLSPCSNDPLICFPEIPDPEFTILNEPCPGELFQLQGGPITAGVNPVWTDNNTGAVVGTTYNVSLPEGSYTFSLSKPGCAPQNIDVPADLIIPVLDYLGPDDNAYLCQGEPLDMTIAVSGATVNFIEWTLNGTPISNTTSYSVAAVTSLDAGQYSININYGDGCDTAFIVNLQVSPEILVDITPVDTSLCLFQEVTFTARPPGGGSFPPEFELSWDFGAATGPTYTFETFQVGVQTVILEITDNTNPMIPCIQEFQQTYTVNELPSVTIDPLSSSICFGESITLTATPAGGLPPYTYLWGPDEIVTTQTYTVAPPYPSNLTDIFVTIRDANGCEEYSFFAEVEINTPPGQPILNCSPICVSELEFSWSNVGADFYRIYASINGAPEMLIDDDYRLRSYLFTGLNGGDQVEFRVVPYTGNQLMNCEGVGRSRRCSTPLTSSPGFIVGFPDPVCIDGGNNFFDLSVSAGEPGTFVFNSTTLGLADAPADADGTTMIALPALQAGQNSATHSIDIHYEGIGGRCPSDTTIQITVTQSPPADFTLDATEICGFSGTFTATINTPVTANDTYTLALADPAVGSVTPNGAGVWDITINTAGTHTVVLTTGNALNPGCTSMFQATVTLTPPSPAPVIVCGAVGLDFVTFSWNDTGADSIIVNEVSIPAGGVVVRNGNSVRVNMLNVLDEVTISVTAVTAGCPNVTSAEQTCVAESCPDITVNIDDVGPFCASLDQDIAMAITATGSDGSGILSWFINGAPFNGIINPSLLGPGNYSVRALLDEGCDFIDVFQVVIRPVPSSVFSLPDGPICTDSGVLGAAAGAVQAGFTYQWTAVEATVAPGNDAASRNFSWSAPGRYYVSLQVTNQFGCAGTVYTDSIDVVAPLAVPLVTCDTVDMESVTFTWPGQAGVATYQIVVNGMAPFTQDSTTLYVGGLAVDSTVTIEVLPIATTPCPILPGSTSCTTVPCPALVLQRPMDRVICDQEADPRTLLTATVTGDNGMGTLTFSGAGVIQVGPDYYFDTDTAGLGSHLLTVDFVEGMCVGQQTFTYTVNEKPTSDFNVNGAATGIDLCVDEVFTLTYTGSVTAVTPGNVSFSYAFLQNVAAVVDTTGFQTYEFRFTQAGPFRIALIVNQEGCPSDTSFVDGTVFAPLPVPVVSCAATDLNSVTFSWNDTGGAEGYTVLRSGDAPQVIFTNQITYNGLLPGEAVTIEVVANDSGPCGDSAPSTAFTCRADDCPTLDIDLSSIPDQICILDGDEFISLTDLVVTGGTGNGTYTFNGTGVSRDTFFAATVPFNEAGTTYTITLDYVEEGPCDLSTSFDVTVFARPTAFFTDPGAQCLGDTFRILIGSTNFVSNDDIIVDFDGGILVPYADPDDNEYFLYFDTPGTHNLTTTVISNISGCPSLEANLTIEVSTPLADPVVSCVNPQLESVTFDWDPVPSATGYLFRGEDGSTVTLTAAETEHTMAGLTPSQTFTGTVQALGDAPCGNGEPVPVSCQTLDCPPGVIQSDTPPTAICLNASATPILLAASLTTGPISGPVTWSGQGVVDNGDGTFSFDPAGLPSGDYVLTVSYDGPSSCDSEDQVTMTLNDLPTVTLSPTPAQLCVGQTMVVSFTGTAAPGAAYAWDFGDAQVTDLGNESYELSWLTPGTKPVALVVTDNCTDSTSFSVVVDPTMEAPMPTCAQQDLDAVEFSWPAVAGATSYRYSIDGGLTYQIQTGTTLRVPGLAFGEQVTLTVIAVRTGTTCNESPASTPVDCAARTCPDITFAPAAAQTEFCNDETQQVILEANLNGDDGSGDLSWTGPGVINNGGVFSFDPTQVGLGVSRLYVTYVQEGLCIYTDSLDMEVFPVPTVAFNPIPASLCQGAEFNVFFTGSAAPGATYTWDFDGAVVTNLGNESYLLRWDTPGTKTVTLTVEDQCIASDSFTLPVTPTLDAPVPTCARQDLDGVLFEWPAVAAATVGYRISINGGPFSAPQPETTFFVPDLDFGENVTISVISVRSGTTCDESAPSATVSCAARVCPDVTMNPMAAQTSFCADETTLIELNANLTGHDGTGTTVWTGGGVSEANGVFHFDPAMAGVGTHTVVVTYTQETLCSYTASMTMTVYPIPSADFTEDNSLICTTGSSRVSLSGTPLAGATYAWDFAGASATDNGNQSYDLRWAAAGTYDVVLTVTSNGCVNTTTHTIVVEEPLNPGTAVSGVLEVCAGTVAPIYLSSRISGASPGGVWSVVSGGGVANGSLNASTGVLNPSGLAAGTYRFAYTLTGIACPVVATEVDLRLLGAPVADAGPQQTLTCSMGMVSLDGSNSETGPGYTYLWSSADPNLMIMNPDQMMVDVGQPGVYQLQVTNAIGCTSVSEVTVTAETEAPVMELQISQITCFASDNGAIVVSGVSGGRPPYTYLLNGESRGASTLFAGLAAGEYDLQITDANGCFSNILLNLTQPDELTIRLRFPGDSAFAVAGEEIFITASVNGGNAIDTLIWQPESLTTGDGQNGISFIASETRMISVTVIDELGCSATDNQMLLVRKERPVYFPTAFSPNGDNNNDIYFIGGDIDQIDYIEDFFIFDRWGEAVYTAGQVSNTGTPATGDGSRFLPNDPAFGWDGMLNGKPMNPQVLVYTATVHFTDGEVIVYKGDFVLMR